METASVDEHLRTPQACVLVVMLREDHAYQAGRAHHPDGPRVSATMSRQRRTRDGLRRTDGQQKGKTQEAKLHMKIKKNTVEEVLMTKKKDLKEANKHNRINEHNWWNYLCTHQQLKSVFCVPAGSLLRLEEKALMTDGRLILKN